MPGLTSPATVCTRPPGERFDHSRGFGPCDCAGCLTRRDREAAADPWKYLPESADPDAW